MNNLIKIIEEEKFERRFGHLLEVSKNGYTYFKGTNLNIDVFKSHHLSSLLALLQGIDKWAGKKRFYSNAEEVIKLADLHLLLSDTIKSLKDK